MVFLVKFTDTLAGKWFLIFNVIDTLDTAIYKFDKLHFKLEIVTILYLAIEVVYLLAEIICALSQLSWLLFIHKNKMIRNANVNHRYLRKLMVFETKADIKL